MIEPTSTTSGSDHVTLREFELWQKGQSNEAILRQRTLEEARDALKELVNSRFDAAQAALTLALQHHDRRLDEHHETLLRERGMVRDYLAQLRAADQTAIQKAEDSVNKRLEAMNELRTQISTERSDYVRSDTYSARHDELIARINALEVGAGNLQGRIAMAAAVTGVGVTVILTVVVIIVNLLTGRG